MAKLMMGTEEVSKVMMGTTEITSLFIGSEDVSPSGGGTTSWMFITSGFNRSLPITKVRYYMKNVPAGTARLGATEGGFCECPNINIDGNSPASYDQEAYCYPRYHKFNMVYGGGKYTNGSTTELDITALTEVETGVYELTFDKTVYWGGVERNATTPIYSNGNLIEVCVET